VYEYPSGRPVAVVDVTDRPDLAKWAADVVEGALLTRDRMGTLGKGKPVQVGNKFRPDPAFPYVSY